eukprot:c14616_g1_i1 orf=248-1411(+)
MLMQVGGEGNRPTFFEMAAAQQLPSSLRAALLYSLGVMAQRRPILHKVLDYSDEAFALLMLILEAHSLEISDASFAEALYGLRRRPMVITVGGNEQEAQKASLNRQQRRLSLLFLVGLPYLKSKFQAAYNAQRQGMLQVALWGRGDLDATGTEPFSTEAASSHEASWHEENPSWARFLRRKMNDLFICLYPCIHATHEGLSFAYQLLYLLDAVGFYTPALHIMRIHVCRTSGQEVMDAMSRLSQQRNHEFERLRGPPLIQAFQRRLLQTIYATLDYAQTGLIAAVFLFKMVEWWYQSAEERITAPSVYPPPPPPPPPKVAEKGVPLPSDRRLCPLCSQMRTNPALISISGFVFCYPCIFKYINQYKRCPVTLMPATVDQIRRLYHDT